MSNAVETIKKPTAFEVELAEYEPQIAAALPAHISPERFKRVVVTAINQNPDLYHADRRSLFTSCVRAAQDGLLPDGREAALVIFKVKNQQTGEWRQAVQYMPMIQGIIKRMRNSGDVAAVDAQLVHQKDEFVYRLGDDPKIEHKPALTDRGAPIAAYAIIRLTNGEVLREVMGKDDIEKVRSVSRAKDNGPWVAWWGEMARKTVLRRCAKRAPVSSDLDELLRRDDEEHFDQTRPASVVGLARPTRTPLVEHQQPQPEQKQPTFTVTDAEGTLNEYPAAAPASSFFQEQMTAAARISGDALQGLWESNGLLLTQLRERGKEETADMLGKAYTELLAEVEAKERAKKDPEKTAEKAKPAAQGKATERKSDQTKGEQPAAEKATQAKPAASARAKYVPPEKAPSPPPPFGTGNWIAWLGFFVEEIRRVPVEQIPDLLAEANYGKVYDYVAEKRPQDRDAIDAILDERRR